MTKLQIAFDFIITLTEVKKILLAYIILNIKYKLKGCLKNFHTLKLYIHIMAAEERVLLLEKFFMRELLS